MLAGAGDELQGIKRGIMEMADALVINKADGDNVKKAELAKQEYLNALHLFPPSESGWIPTVKTCSSLNNQGIDAIWDVILEYTKMTRENGYFNQRRKDQELKIFYESIGQRLQDHFYANTEVREKMELMKQKITNNQISSYRAGNILLDFYFKTLKENQ